jgi:hypothetical protein
MKISLLVLLLATGITSCQKGGEKKVVRGDYMIVGWTGGFAGYGVHNYYLISNGKLMKDVSKWTVLPDSINQFDFSEVLSQSKYDSVKDLPAAIPPELLGRNNADIGMYGPDMGFTDVRTTIGGVAYRWRFEANQDSSSAAIQQFVAKTKMVF